ncbi:ATP-grasp domain-containing protein [Calothrix sp. UHCC 0171]|uniref:ATP-grasp domain-containing protein n=1 Tax=Calothrix sp. UHCC 0171 TaxID=3110245 RepID=UPI002B2151FC|nr:ATP-grasp domain-containing protein [Calothrix sp. UHCC 0171]MEA5573349.1 ATP-grasp domain-containing protein [Calothrix sp. UHCC 0171]
MNNKLIHNILLTGGRAPVTLELARFFTTAGYQVFVADSIKHHLCTNSRYVFKNFLVPQPRYNSTAYIQALLEIVKQENIHLLIPTCEEIFYISHGLIELNKYCQVFAETVHILNQLHNKWEFICQVKKLDLVTPQTWLVKSKAEIIDILQSSNSFHKLILKPVYSRFASNIHILSPKNYQLSVQEIEHIQISKNKTWVVQEFISGKHYCSYSIVHQGKITAHAAYPTVFTAGKGSCIYFEAVNHPQILQWVKTFVESLKFTGQIAFDFIEANDILYPLECNPRAISAIHLFQVSDKLETAFLNTTSEIIQPQMYQRAMISMAMLVYGLPDAIRYHQFRQWLKIFFSTKDVIFRISDVMPFFSIFIILWQSLLMSFKTGLSLIQVSTQDIEWDGENIELLMIDREN